jgi:oxygen-independent coproporphyrinogen-3 oxidase
MKPSQRRFTEAELPVGEAKLQLYLLGKKLIQEAGYLDVGMDHFALPDDELYIASQNNQLHRNFMGYTDRHIPLLIGLGVSSISDSWFGFAQNVKTVETYHEMINANQLPLMKGHILTTEDLQLRRQILDIMCKGKTFLYKYDPLFSGLLDRLQPMLADQLITLENQAEFNALLLQVTEMGKQFLRNICMAFDLRLLRNTEKQSQFSQAV